LNYQDNDTTTTITEDNDWTYTDNSDRSVSIYEDNDTTTNTITNTNTNVEGSYNTNSNNTTTVAQRDDDDRPRNRDFEVECIPSETNVYVGTIVEYRVRIIGGSTPYDIEWRGAVDGDEQEERVRYNQAGSYSVSVIVEDDRGRRAIDECAVVVVRAQGTLVSSGTTYVQPTGQLASLTAVSLSQVPYTGPADVLKVLGVIALIVLWSLGGAYWLKKRRANSNTTNSIQAFKEANKAAATIS
jgi:hypothetical protein